MTVVYDFGNLRGWLVDGPDWLMHTGPAMSRDEVERCVKRLGFCRRAPWKKTACGWQAELRKAR